MDEVVIAGISGRLPESNTLEEFWENLIGGVDMVTEDDRRWKPGKNLFLICASKNRNPRLMAFPSSVKYLST